MKLSYILESLASAEVSNLNLAEDFLSIKQDKLPIVLRAINAGLADIYTRFLLRKAIAEVQTEPGQYEYEVPADDLVEILSIMYDGAFLEPNTDYVLLDINKVKFKQELGLLNPIVFEYKARHRPLTEVDVELDSEVGLPMSYLNALLYFVASKLFTSIVNQMDGDLNEGVTYLRKYQAEIKMLDAQGIDVNNLEDMNIFKQRGFV